MTSTAVFRCKNYELQCSSRPVDNGKFEPTLIVCSTSWPSRPRTIAVERGDWATEALAIDSAHAQGLQWVAHFG